MGWSRVAKPRGTRKLSITLSICAMACTTVFAQNKSRVTAKVIMNVPTTTSFVWNTTSFTNEAPATCFSFGCERYITQPHNEHNWQFTVLLLLPDGSIDVLGCAPNCRVPQENAIVEADLSDQKRGLIIRAMNVVKLTFPRTISNPSGKTYTERYTLLGVLQPILPTGSSTSVSEPVAAPERPINSPVLVKKACAAPAIAVPHATAVVYYMEQTFPRPSVPIYVDGSVTCALRQGRYLILPLLPGSHTIRSSQKDGGDTLDFLAGSVHYYKVYGHDTGLLLQADLKPSNPEVVAFDLRQLSPQDCETKPLPSAAATQEEVPKPAPIAGQPFPSERAPGLASPRADFPRVPAPEKVERASPRSSSLNITSNPDGADISVNGKFIGTSPVVIEVAPGDEVITISKPGYRVWTRRVSVTSGTVSVDAKLAECFQYPCPGN